MSLASERSWQIQFYVCGNCFSFLLHTFFTTYVTNFLSVLFLGVPERFHWNELSFVKQLYLRNSYTYNFLALKRVYFCVKSYATYYKSRPCENSLADLYTFAFLRAWPYVFFCVRELIFEALGIAELQKFARHFTHGFDFSIS